MALFGGAPFRTGMGTGLDSRANRVSVGVFYNRISHCTCSVRNLMLARAFRAQFAPITLSFLSRPNASPATSGAHVAGRNSGMTIANVPAAFQGDRIAHRMPIRPAHGVAATSFAILALRPCSEPASVWGSERTSRNTRWRPGVYDPASPGHAQRGGCGGGRR